MRALVLGFLFAASSSPPATLEFQSGWKQVQHGTLVHGGHVEVRYDRTRMGRCANATVFSYARFLPSGQLFSSDEAFSFDVPADAEHVELWFHAVSPECDQWDSDYGRNWWFPVAPTP
jgi:hypothetical protein